MKGWKHESYRHSLAARRIKTSKSPRKPKIKVYGDEAIVRKRGKAYRVTLKSEHNTDAELKRLAKLPLKDIKKRYKKSIEEESYYAEKTYPHLLDPAPLGRSSDDYISELQARINQSKSELNALRQEAAQKGVPDADAVLRKAIYGARNQPEVEPIIEEPIYPHPITEQDFLFPEEKVMQ